MVSSIHYPHTIINPLKYNQDHKGFRTSDPQRNVMSQSTEMSPLVSMLVWTFLNPLKFLMEIFNILVLIEVHAQLFEA